MAIFHCFAKAPFLHVDHSENNASYLDTSKLRQIQRAQ